MPNFFVHPRAPLRSAKRVSGCRRASVTREALMPRSSIPICAWFVKRIRILHSLGCLDTQKPEAVFQGLARSVHKCHFMCCSEGTIENLLIRIPAIECGGKQNEIICNQLRLQVLRSAFNDIGKTSHEPRDFVWLGTRICLYIDPLLTRFLKNRVCSRMCILKIRA